MAHLTLDPMRGRGTALVNGVIQLLFEEGFFTRDRIESMPGGADFLRDSRDYSLATASAQTGVSEEKIRRCAAMIREARRVALVHSPDRPRDRAPGDMHALSNLLLLLRSAGVEADLVLAYQAGNAAGIEVCGADPAFAAGRRPADGRPGARTRRELLDALAQGEIKAALVIGEDPLRHDRTAALFDDLDFLAACDWAETETTLFANVALPMTTYLETEGTRIDYAGRVKDFRAAVGAPNGIKTWHVLKNIGDRLGVPIPGVFATISAQLAALVHASQEDKLALYFNTGQTRRWDGTGRLIVADVDLSSSPGAPALTACAQYKSEVQEIGIRDYRVGARRAAAGS